MTKTSDEVIAEALRMIGVLNLEDDPQTADAAQGLVHLNALFAELDDTHAIAPEWTVDTVPERLFLPLSTALAGSLALQYRLPEFVSLRSKGINQIRADEFGNKPEAAPRAVYY